MLSCVWLFVASWTVVRQAPLPMEFSRQEFWSGLPFPFPVDLPDPGVEPSSPVSPALTGGFFTSSATWEAPYCEYDVFSHYGFDFHFPNDLWCWYLCLINPFMCLWIIYITGEMSIKILLSIEKKFMLYYWVVLFMYSGYNFFISIWFSHGVLIIL